MRWTSHRCGSSVRHNVNQKWPEVLLAWCVIAIVATRFFCCISIVSCNGSTFFPALFNCVCPCLLSYFYNYCFSTAVVASLWISIELCKSILFVRIHISFIPLKLSKLYYLFVYFYEILQRWFAKVHHKTSVSLFMYVLCMCASVCLSALRFLKSELQSLMDVMCSDDDLLSDTSFWRNEVFSVQCHAEIYTHFIAIIFSL